MSNATPRGTGRTAGLCFVLAVAVLVIGGFSNPSWLALAFGLVAMGLVARRTRQQTVVGAALLALLVLASGYLVGKDMAHRDNARAVPSSHA